MIRFAVAIKDEDAPGGLDSKDFTNRVVSALDEIKEKFLCGKDGGVLFNKEGHKVGTWGDKTINDTNCVFGPFEASCMRDEHDTSITLKNKTFSINIETSPLGLGLKRIFISDGHHGFAIAIDKDFSDIRIFKNGLRITSVV